MHSRKCSASGVNEARKELFTQCSLTMENIPPTKAALLQHVRRVGIVYSNLPVLLFSSTFPCISLTEIRKFFLVIARYYSLSVIMSATSSVKKRKVDIEHRAFNPAWEEKYFFIERFWTGPVPHKILLEDCYRPIEFNMRRHWKTELASIKLCVEVFRGKERRHR